MSKIWRFLWHEQHTTNVYVVCMFFVLADGGEKGERGRIHICISLYPSSYIISSLTHWLYRPARVRKGLYRLFKRCDTLFIIWKYHWQKTILRIEWKKSGKKLETKLWNAHHLWWSNTLRMKPYLSLDMKYIFRENCIERHLYISL